MIAAPSAADPALADALFIEACRHHREGKTDRAKRLFERVLALDPGHVNTLCNLGAIELGLGHAAQAQAFLQSAVTLAPELAPARTALADVLMAVGKLEQAQAQYRRALELAPMSDAAHARYAIALHELGDFDAAMTHFLAATKINQQQSSHFYEALGRTCAARGNVQGAEISLRHVLALEPRRVSAHCALGELYLAHGRRADAEASFRHALAIDANHAAALRGIEHSRGSAAREGMS
jgi:tetratricopeptide (TPR) repeat protein